MMCLAKRDLHECGGIHDQQRTACLERLCVLDADEAPDVLVLDAEPFQSRGLRPAEDRLVDVDCRGLSLVDASNINCEVELAPRPLHPAVAIEQPIDLVRIGIRE